MHCGKTFTPPLEISNQNFRANYMKISFLWAKPLSDTAECGLNVTIHKHHGIYSQKGTAERKYRSEMS